MVSVNDFQVCLYDLIKSSFPTSEEHPYFAWSWQLMFPTLNFRKQRQLLSYCILSINLTYTTAWYGTSVLTCRIRTANYTSRVFYYFPCYIISNVFTNIGRLNIGYLKISLATNSGHHNVMSNVRLRGNVHLQKMARTFGQTQYNDFNLWTLYSLQNLQFVW